VRATYRAGSGERTLPDIGLHGKLFEPKILVAVAGKEFADAGALPREGGRANGQGTGGPGRAPRAARQARRSGCASLGETVPNLSRTPAVQLLAPLGRWQLGRYVGRYGCQVDHCGSLAGSLAEELRQLGRIARQALAQLR
jgi:hypothetical protein